MLGCPPAVPALTPVLAVDDCAGDQPIGSALELFLLLNAVGLATFLCGVGLLTFRRLVGNAGEPG